MACEDPFTYPRDRGQVRGYRISQFRDRIEAAHGPDVLVRPWCWPQSVIPPLEQLLAEIISKART